MLLRCPCFDRIQALLLRLAPGLDSSALAIQHVMRMIEKRDGALARTLSATRRETILLPVISKLRIKEGIHPTQMSFSVFMRGARAQNPGNRRLQEIARAFGLAETPLRDASAPRALEISIGTLPTTTEQFVGRVAELARLTAAWEDATTHVVTIVAWGGSGKTTLVTAWLADMASAGWRGAERVFVWSFYSQGARSARAASADAFVSAALSFFADPDREATVRVTAPPAGRNGGTCRAVHGSGTITVASETLRAGTDVAAPLTA